MMKPVSKEQSPRNCQLALVNLELRKRNLQDYEILDTCNLILGTSCEARLLLVT